MGENFGRSSGGNFSVLLKQAQAVQGNRLGLVIPESDRWDPSLGTMGLPGWDPRGKFGASGWDSRPYDPRCVNGKMVDPPSRPYPLAIGVGHDDHNLERTYAELEALKAAAPDGRIRTSDASGWDMSVSAATFWCALEFRLSRATSLEHFRAMLINGFFQSSWVVCTGHALWESNRFGITGSGSGITTSKNSQERSMGSVFGQMVHELGGLNAVEELQPTQMVALCSEDKWGSASTGDDNLHTHPIDVEAVKTLGTLMRDSEESAARS